LRTALDTNVISGLWSAGPLAPRVATLLARCRHEGGLAISGAVYAELLAHPRASIEFVNAFLRDAEIAIDFELGAAAWELAGLTFAAYATRRRRSSGGGPRRILADFLIGAHAQVHTDRLATLDARGYAGNFPDLPIVVADWE
jgi:predicted nucleic acid-binding protein